VYIDVEKEKKTKRWKYIKDINLWLESKQEGRLISIFNCLFSILYFNPQKIQKEKN